GDDHDHEDARPHASTSTKGPDRSCVGKIRRRASMSIAENVHSDLLRRLEVQACRQSHTGTTAPKRGAFGPDAARLTCRPMVAASPGCGDGPSLNCSPLTARRGLATSCDHHNLPRMAKIKSMS